MVKTGVSLQSVKGCPFGQVIRRLAEWGVRYLAELRHTYFAVIRATKPEVTSL